VVATFAADYAQMLTGGESVIGTLRSVGESAVSASATATEALERLGVAADSADGQLSLFGEAMTQAAGQLTLFATEADRVAAQVSVDDTTISASSEAMAAAVEAAAARGQAALDMLSITQAGDAAVWERSMATESAAIDTMVANLEAQAVKADAAIASMGDAMQATEARAVTFTSASEAMYGATATALGGIAIKAGAVAAIVAGATVDMASKFDQSMELIKTQAHDGTDSIASLSQSVLQMAGDVGQTPDKLAEALYHITSTGQTGAAALDILKASAKDATIGMADLDTVAYAMSGVMSVGMKDVTGAADGVAYLNTIVGQGDMHMQDLANAIGTGVLPAFKAAGLGMADFGAALSTLTDNSTPAEVAANHLKTTVQLLQNQSGPAAAALAQLGIKSGELGADISKPGGLMVAVMDLKTHMDDYTKSAGGMKLTQDQINTSVSQMAAELTKEGVATGEQTDLLNSYRSSLGTMGSAGIQAAADLSKAFGGARSAMTMETLVQESGKLQSKYNEMGTAATRQAQAQTDWNNTQAQFKVKLQDTKAAAESLGISVGNLLMPAVMKIMDLFKGFANVLSNNHGLIVAIAIVIGGALVVALAALTAGTIAWAIAIQGTPIGWFMDVVALLAGLAYILVNHWSSISGFFSDIWKSVVGFFSDAARDIGDVVTFIIGIPADIGNFFAALPGILGNAATTAGRALLNGLKTAGSAVLDFFKNLPYNAGFLLGRLTAILLKAGGDAINGLFHGINVAWDAVGAWFIALPGNIKSFTIDAGKWLLNAGIDVITVLKNGIVTAAEAVGQFFLNLPKDIQNFFASAGTWLSTSGLHILEGLGRGIVNGSNAVEAWFYNLPGNVLSWLGDVGSWLLNAGKNIVMGLLHGIENAGSWLLDQIKSFAKGVIAGFLSAFGVHSPATTMQPVGAGIVMGVAKGITDNLHLMTSAAQTAVSTVMGGLTGNGSLGSIGVNATGSLNVTGGPGAGGAGAAPIIVNLNVGGSVVAVKDLAYDLQTAMAQIGQKNSITWRAYKR
jgi:hypothetical protein